MNALRERLARARAWVMWTRTRSIAAVFVVALVAVVVVIGTDWVVRVVQWREQVAAYEAAAQAPATPTATTAPSASPSPTGLVLGGGLALGESGQAPTPVSPSEEIEGARLAADRFTAAWLAGAGTTDVNAWAATVSPLVVPDLAQALPLTDPAAIPTAQLEQVKVVLFAADLTLARADLADGTQITMSLVHPDQQWLVGDYSPTP